jgi:hypothetical protein
VDSEVHLGDAWSCGCHETPGFFQYVLCHGYPLTLAHESDLTCPVCVALDMVQIVRLYESE